ncbi:MAG: DUF1553 domain-containing protein, partial [Planctomycetaceae bacterium]|nr:DUF1553 domain-containing protein [Planctomycetaceae bacterium]
AESGMPTMVSVSDDSGPRSQKIVAVPQVSGAVLRRTDFPDNVAVIDFRKAQEAGITATIAGADSPSPTNADVAASIVGSKVALSTETINDGTSAVAAPAAVEPERWAVSPGGAALWKAVPETRLTSSETVRQVDAILESVWKKADVEPTDQASPEELLRRVYLDLAGRTPGVSEVRSFLNDTSPDRYEALVNRLLNSHDHASHLATVWRSFLIPDGVDLTAFGGIEAFDRWLAERFESHDSYDQVVRSLLLADGRLSRSGPLLFYSAARLDPDRLAAKTARVFLGMRLECAQCHDHPFEPWKQTDFWGYAAFFARISRPQGTLENVSTVMRVSDVDRGEVMLPETKNVVAPKFLNSKESLEEVEGANRREQLTNWMLAPDNPYFARATANRVWGQMFGRGIVDPIDDFGVQNSPVSQELLDVLAGSFLQSGFNLQELFRTVALSRAYRLSSGAQTIDEDRPAVFAQMNIKTLTAEQVYDCISVATMLGNTEGGPTGLFDLVRYGNSSREAFLQQFRTPAGQPTVYLGGIPQALTLMNGQLIENATGLSSSGLLKSLEAPFFSNEQRLEVLYLATLSRPPRANEWELLRDYVPENATGNELQEALADVLWALLNSAEFTMNH